MTPSAPLVQLSAKRGRPPRHLADMTPEERAEVVVEAGEPAMRARQIAAHYFSRLTADAADMTDLPAARREELAALLAPELLAPLTARQADDGRTVKTLWRLFDGARIETVLMRYPGRITLCVSSQAGCGMACPFCATGTMGLVRNLSAGEIVEQVRLAARDARDGALAGGPGRLSNVVFMGMGEPLGNYKALMTAIRAIVAPAPGGLGLSARGVTVSTCGLVPGIGRLAAEGLPLTLALSLHAPDDEARDMLVPVNRRWPVTEVLAAAHSYFEATGRRVSIEYALIRDVNDQAWRADLLAERLTRYGTGWVHVNPIPLNPVPGSRWTASRASDEDRFVARLEARGLTVTIRDTRGRDIDGACGQLAAEGSTDG